ncbi:hypothetical protein ACIQB5_51515 [Streptomyces sp. NPDC088560]|uniref:hypothetical protein n=1 Tax=Streptomyces sp. NPDC088560 TaxID=3365868 RepID=UPI00380ED01D
MPNTSNELAGRQASAGDQEMASLAPPVRPEDIHFRSPEDEAKLTSWAQEVLLRQSFHKLGMGGDKPLSSKDVCKANAIMEASKIKKAQEKAMKKAAASQAPGASGSSKNSTAVKSSTEWMKEKMKKLTR